MCVPNRRVSNGRMTTPSGVAIQQQPSTPNVPVSANVPKMSPSLTNNSTKSTPNNNNKNNNSPQLNSSGSTTTLAPASSTPKQQQQQAHLAKLEPSSAKPQPPTKPSVRIRQIHRPNIQTHTHTCIYKHNSIYILYEINIASTTTVEE